VIVGAVLWLLYAGWGSEHVAVYGAFAVPLVATVIAWIVPIWRAKSETADPGDKRPVLDSRADRLAEAVRQQWEQAAGERGLLAPEPIPVSWERSARPLAGSAAAAVEARRFDPLPGLPPAGITQLAEGKVSDLHAVYGGIGSGRLVIAGAPGAGKSGAAVLLLLAAVRYREQMADKDRPTVPVPVLFTAQGWDPVNEPLRDWLAGQMRQTYEMFTGKAGAADAAALVANNKIALILDGLDELAEDLRPAALQALSQRAFRIVVLSRTYEMESAASQQGILEGAAAIELCTIDPATAADYLSRAQRDPPPEGWRDLIDRIRTPESSLARALDNPLTLTLVKDTYRAGDDVRELLEFCDTVQRREHGERLAEEITDHLLDRVIPVAYTRRPGERPPVYDCQTAQRTLIKIAARMNQDHSRDLQWWYLPQWVPTAPRILTSGLGFGLGFGLGWFGQVAELGFGLMARLVAGLMIGLVVGLGFGIRPGYDTPRKLRKPRLRQALRHTNLVAGLRFGLVAGLVVGLVVGLGFGLVVGLVGVLVVGLAGVLNDGLEDALQDPDSTRSLTPLDSWRNDTKYWRRAVLGSMLGFGLVVGLVGGLVIGLGAWPVTLPVARPVGGLVIGLGCVLVFGLLGVLAAWPGAWLFSSAGSSSLAAAELSGSWHTPVRLMRFLDEARERGVLRTVGPVYQFRHARLQDRLGRQDSSTE
jgi:hypothetical protein